MDVEQRARFESWAKARGLDLHRLKHTGGYRSALTADAWAAWQAAITPPKDYVLVPIRVLRNAYAHIEREIHFRGGDSSIRDALADALSASQEVKNVHG